MESYKADLRDNLILGLDQPLITSMLVWLSRGIS